MGLCCLIHQSIYVLVELLPVVAGFVAGSEQAAASEYVHFARPCSLDGFWLADSG
jgi:hypothetical protein